MATDNINADADDPSLEQPKLNFLPDRNHGRSDEVATLRRLYRQSSGRKQVALISGPPGCGKSSLARSLRLLAAADHTASGSGKPKSQSSVCGGWYAEGAFDPIGGGEVRGEQRPFSGIVDALGSLAVTLRHHLQQQQHEAYEVRAKDIAQAKQGRRAAAARRIASELRREMSVDVALALTRVAPAMADILGTDFRGSTQVLCTGIEANEARNKLTFALHTFFRVMCRDINTTGVLVLVLDDCHNIDKHSANLLRSLVEEEDCAGFLLALVSRDDGANETLYLPAFVDNLREAQGINVDEVSLDQLDQEAVTYIVADAIRSEREEVEELASVIYHKTRGNALAVKEFLAFLVRKKLLRFNIGLFRWEWDLGGAQELPVAENVSELFEMRIWTLKQEARRLLSICACLGNAFSFDVVPVVVRALIDYRGEAEAENEPALAGYLSLSSEDMQQIFDHEILEQRGHDVVAFAHPQLQSTAFLLIPEEIRSEVQYKIGRALLEHLSTERQETMLFVITDLLNHGVNSHPGELIDMAKRNLLAGKEAAKKAAFGQSSRYFETSIDCITRHDGENRWTAQKALCEEAYIAAAMSEEQIGNYDTMRHFLHEILSNVDSRKGRMQAYCTKAMASIATGEFSECLNLLSEVSENILHERMPLKATMSTIIIELVRTKRLLKKYANHEDILGLPPMEDEVMVLAFKLLEQVVAASWCSDPKFFVIIILKMVQWTLKYGLCLHSAGAFSAYGTLCTSLKDLKRGHDYGKLGLAILKKVEDDGIDGVNTEYAYTTLLACQSASYQIPALRVSKEVRFAYQVGMSSGDTSYSCHCLSLSIMLQYFAGKSLPGVALELKRALPQLRYYGQEYTVARLNILLQTILNLSGENNSDPLSIGSDLVGGETGLRDMCQRIGISLLKYSLVLKQWLAYLLGDKSLAAALSDDITDFGTKYGKAHMLAVRFTLYDGLVALQVLADFKAGSGRCSWAGSRRGVNKWKKRKNSRIKAMRAWAKKGNLNATHALLLMEAEEYALRSTDSTAVRDRYDSAIRAASKVGALHDLALGNERAGIYFLDKDTQWAKGYIAKSYELYCEYGAHAVAERIQTEHPHFISDEVIARASDVSKRQSRRSIRDSSQSVLFRESSLDELTTSVGSGKESGQTSMIKMMEGYSTSTLRFSDSQSQSLPSDAESIRCL